MSGILYLNVDDFIIRKGEKGNLLCLNYDVQGLSLVLFYSNECQHCTKLMGRYKQLPFNINGCQFTMINVNKAENRRVVQLSNQTIVPITYVPDIILYVDGIPYMRYDGNHDIQSIKSFILDIYQQLQKTAFLESKQASSNNANDRSASSQKPPTASQTNSASRNQQPPQNGSSSQFAAPSNAMPENVNKAGNNTIPAYTIGKPKCSGERDDVCYVTFTEAYNSGTPAQPPQNTRTANPRQQGSQPVFYNQQQVH
jgi:hypothetical protein